MVELYLVAFEQAIISADKISLRGPFTVVHDEVLFGNAYFFVFWPICLLARPLESNSSAQV